MERFRVLENLKNKYTIPVVLGFLFLVVGVLTLPDYGVNWDEPFHFLRGQAYAQFFLTGKKTYDQPPRLSPVLIKPGDYISRYDASAWEETEGLVNLPSNPRPQAEFTQIRKETNSGASFYEHDAWNGKYFIAKDGPGHPPLIDIISAFSNRFFYQALGLVGDIESYKIPYVVISAFGVFLVSIFAYETTGSRFGSLVAGLALATYPIFWAGSHFNVKDTELAVFYLGAIWAFWRWVKDENHWWRNLIIFDIFIALSLGTKWNIVFLPFSLIPWLLFIRRTDKFKAWFKIKKIALALPLSLVAVLGFVVIIWPYMWADPMNRLLGVFRFYESIGHGPDVFKPDGFDLPFGMDRYPITLLVTQAPIITFVLALLGIATTFIKKPQDSLKLKLLAGFWIVVPIARTIIPGFTVYGGTRQVEEFVPAVAILAAFGSTWLITRLKSKFQTAGKILILAIFAIFMVSLWRFYPNDNVYFNFLAGGVRGAQEKNLIDRLVSYGNIYKQAALWLNANAPQGAKVAFLNGPTFAISPLWLRNDISISPNFFSYFEREGEYVIVPYSAVDMPNFTKRYLLRFLNPVKIIYVDGAPILYIFKNSSQYVKNGFSEEQRIEDFEAVVIADPDKDYLQVNLKKPIKLTRIELKNVSPQCAVPDFHYINELVLFFPRKLVNGVDENIFSTNERRYTGEGKVEIYFPGEYIRMIKIIPQSMLSCFIMGKISSIYSLKD